MPKYDITIELIIANQIFEPVKTRLLEAHYEPGKGMVLSHGVIKGTGATQTVFAGMRQQTFDWWIEQYGNTPDAQGNYLRSVKDNNAMADFVPFYLPDFVIKNHLEHLQQERSKARRPAHIFCDLVFQTVDDDHLRCFRVTETSPRELELMDKNENAVSTVSGVSLEAVLWRLDYEKAWRNSIGRYDYDALTMPLDLRDPENLQAEFNHMCRHSDRPMPPHFVCRATVDTPTHTCETLQMVEETPDGSVRLYIEDKGSEIIEGVSVAALRWHLLEEQGMTIDSQGRLRDDSYIRLNIEDPDALQRAYNEAHKGRSEPFVPDLATLTRNIRRLRDPSCQ